MNNPHEIRQKDLEKISIQIRDKIFVPIFTRKTTIFLCGGSLQSNKNVRFYLNKYFQSRQHLYDVIFPEHLFEDLIIGSGKQSLLSLENILAESVDAVIIVPESPGSFAEFGAFSNNSKLRKKLVCIQDEKRIKEKSFINYGPIRLMKTEKEGKVVMVNYDAINGEIDDDNSQSIKKIKNAINEVKKIAPKRNDIVNLLESKNYILPCIYLMEPVHKDILIKMIKYGAACDYSAARAAMESSINLLRKDNIIQQTPNGVCLTQYGIKHFLNRSKKTKTKHFFKTEDLDLIRSEIISCQYRNKMLH